MLAIGRGTLEPREGIMFLRRCPRNGPMRISRVLYRMTYNPYLSAPEWASLAEVGKGFGHNRIPIDHAGRLLELKLIYNLLGSYRILSAGREMLQGIH